MLARIAYWRAWKRDWSWALVRDGSLGTMCFLKLHFLQCVWWDLVSPPHSLSSPYCCSEIRGRWTQGNCSLSLRKVFRNGYPRHAARTRVTQAPGRPKHPFAQPAGFQILTHGATTFNLSAEHSGRILGATVIDSHSRIAGSSV